MATTVPSSEAKEYMRKEDPEFDPDSGRYLRPGELVALGRHISGDPESWFTEDKEPPQPRRINN